MAMDSRCLMFMFGLSASIITLLSLTRSCQGQHLFVFGDSLYDAGNKKYLTPDAVASAYWPYGLSIDRPSGRWSDGIIVPDFIANFMGIPPAPPILDNDANFTSGASFACADATVLGDPPETMSLTIQVRKFVQNRNIWSKEDRESAVYLFYIGANDYLNYTKTHQNPTPEEQQAFINLVIQKIRIVILVIYNSGGRKFGFQNLAPLACLPIVRQEIDSGDPCVELLPTKMAAQHNKNLTETLMNLSELLPGFSFTIFDYFNATMRRINDPKPYRYFSADMACCGSGSHNAFGCGYKNVNWSLCSYQRAYVFYDGRHNAEKTNEAMAHLMFSADPIVISPINLRELWVYPLDYNLLNVEEPYVEEIDDLNSSMANTGSE